jgi:hypothetical protein
MVEAKVKSVLKPDHQKWVKQLGDHEGFVDGVNEKFVEIESDMRNSAMDNDDIKALLNDLGVIMKKVVPKSR